MIGFYVRYLRQQRGWTQNDLAEASGLAQNHISAIERGERENMTHGTIVKLAQAFGISVEELRQQSLAMTLVGENGIGEGKEANPIAPRIAEALAELRKADPTLARIMESILELPSEWRGQAIVQLQGELDLLKSLSRINAGHSKPTDG